MIKFITAMIAWLSFPASVDALEISIQGSNAKFVSQKVATIKGEINHETYVKFRKQMQKTSKLNGDRIIIINPVGGIVGEGLKMLRLIKAEKANKTRLVCYVDKAASSMAFNILSHCDVRIANENAILMFHKMYITGLLKMNAKELRERADKLDRDDEPFTSLNSKLMGLTREEYDSFADKDTNWKATTLLIRGYLHHLGEIKKTP